MKKLFAAAILVAGLSVSALAQTNPSTNLTSGISTVLAGGTSNAISTALFEVKNRDEVVIHWRQQWNLTNALASGNTTTTTIGGSSTTSNLTPIAYIVRPVPSTTNTLIMDVGTNIYIGQWRYIGIISQTSTATNSTVTNMSPQLELGKFTFQFKDKQAIK